MFNQLICRYRGHRWIHSWDEKRGIKGLPKYCVRCGTDAPRDSLQWFQHMTSDLPVTVSATHVEFTRFNIKLDTHDAGLRYDVYAIERMMYDEFPDEAFEFRMEGSDA